MRISEDPWSSVGDNIHLSPNCIHILHTIGVYILVNTKSNNDSLLGTQAWKFTVNLSLTKLEAIKWSGFISNLVSSLILLVGDDLDHLVCSKNPT